jgi:tartrate dehydratase alpha subunit/fumarate hydratase class I-like protein
MKTLNIVSISAFTAKNGSEKFAIQTNEGTMYPTKEYLEKKVKSLGISLAGLLGNTRSYEITMEAPEIHKAGVAYEYTDKDGVVKTATPTASFINGSFNLQLTQAGSLNAMIAQSVSDLFAKQFGFVNAPVAQATASEKVNNLEEVPAEIESAELPE